MTSTARLAQYALAAAAVPAASASAAIVSQTNLNIVLGVGSAQAIDFGGAFGEVFRFDLRGQNNYFFNPGGTYTNTFTTNYGSTYTTTSYQTSSRGGRLSFNPLFQFVGGGAADAAFRANSSFDPLRLASGAPISAAQAFADMFLTSGTGYDLARRFSSFFSVGGSPVSSGYANYGSWNPDARGFVGFSFIFAGATHYGWFDVETRAGLAELVIHGWAFNDEPRGPIAAGEVPAPAAGGLLALAMGAAGLRRSRRSA